MDDFWKEISIGDLVYSSAYNLSQEETMRVEERPSGLLVRKPNVPRQILEMSAEYATLSTLLGVSLTDHEIDRILNRHTKSDLIAAASALVAELYPVGPTMDEVQERLADEKFIGDARDRAKSYLKSGQRVIVPPQVALNSLKKILLSEVGEPNEDHRDIQADAFILALGLADSLGSESPSEGEERWWDVMPMSTAMELTRNQFFNVSFDPAAIIGRWWRIREIAKEEFPDATARFDALFSEATGTNLDIVFAVGAQFFFKMLESKAVGVGKGLISQLTFSEVEMNMAINLMVGSSDTIRAALKAEIEKFGFDWSFNTLRQFPMIEYSEEVFVIMNPAFLLERVCGSAQLWEVRETLNIREDSGEITRGEAKKVRGAFGEYRGGVAEAYVIELFCDDIQKHAERGGLIWNGERMKEIWPDKSICDLLIERENTLVAVEVVAHAMRETAASGGDFEGLSKDLQIAVVEKAQQIDAVVARINEGGLSDSAVGGEYTAIYPVLVNAMRFPWNALIDEAIRAKFRYLGILQQANVRPFVIMSIEEVEALAAVVEREAATVESILEKRFRENKNGDPIQWTLSREYGISRPSIVNDAFGRACDALLAWRGGRA